MKRMSKSMKLLLTFCMLPLIMNAAEKQSISGFFKFQQSLMPEKLYLSFDKPAYQAGDSLWFRGYLLNAVSHSYLVKSNFIYVELYTKKDSLIERKKIRRDDFAFDNNIVLPLSLEPGDYYVRAYTSWMRNFGSEYFFMHNFRVDEASSSSSGRGVNPDNIKVEFYPEGGTLLSGVSQRVAFKVLQSDGTPASFNGFLFNQQNEKLAQVITTHEGMGMLTVTAKSSDALYVATEAGSNVRFALPKAQDKGCSLWANNSDGTLLYKVLGQPQADSLMLVAHCRGKLIMQRVFASTHSQDTISVKKFPDGIVQLLLCKTDGSVLSKRLVFVRNGLAEQWTVTKEKSTYSPREKVSLSVSLKDENGRPLNGDFAVSITDKSQVAPDDEADNILSDILFTSDMKQSVSHPGWYFQKNDPIHTQALDLLMLTSSWGRFETDTLKQPAAINLRYPLEEGQCLSGHIKGLPKNEQGNQISAVSINSNAFGSTKLKSDESFEIDNLQFPDSTVFALKVLSTRKRGIDIVMDDPDFPTPYNKNPFGINLQKLDPNDYAESMKMKKGIKVINLKNVEVTALKSKSQFFKTAYLVASYDKDRLNKEFDMNIIKSALSLVNDVILYQYPNRFVPAYSADPQDGLIGPDNPNYGTRDNSRIASAEAISDNYSYYGRLYTAVVNDQLYEGEESVVGVLERIDSRDISSMEFVSREYNTHNRASAAVIITLKPGAELLPEIPDSRMTYSHPMGYAWPVWFHSPKYETSTRNGDDDNRSTIYWNPSVQLGKEGEATIHFYTSDHPQKYYIVIEGVTFNGRVCRYSAEW